MRSSTPSSHPSPPAATPIYSPSVPLSVYRELAAELQAAQALLDSLNVQNQQLTRQNQQLRQEIEKAVQSVLHLQQVVDATTGSWREAPHSSPNLRAESNRVAAPSPQKYRTSSRPASAAIETSYAYQPQDSVSPGFSETVFTEQEENRYLRRSPIERATEINGWWLAIAIFLIVATAFGTGYLIVRPLLQHR